MKVVAEQDGRQLIEIDKIDTGHLLGDLTTVGAIYEIDGSLTGPINVDSVFAHGNGFWEEPTHPVDLSRLEPELGIMLSMAIDWDSPDPDQYDQTFEASELFQFHLKGKHNQKTHGGHASTVPDVTDIVTVKGSGGLAAKVVDYMDYQQAPWLKLNQKIQNKLWHPAENLSVASKGPGVGSPGSTNEPLVGSTSVGSTKAAPAPAAPPPPAPVAPKPIEWLGVVTGNALEHGQAIQTPNGTGSFGKVQKEGGKVWVQVDGLSSKKKWYTADQVKAAVQDGKGVKYGEHTGTPAPHVTPPAPHTPTPAPAASTGGFPQGVWQTQNVQTLGGSTGAMLVKGPDGTLYVKKQGASAEHITAEYHANQVYKAAGVDVPDSKLYGGDTQLAQHIKGTELGKLKGAEFEAAAAKLRDNFVLDAVMGNRDVIGLASDNVLVGADGKVWRIDNGASFDFRAQGNKKEFGPKADEIDSMRDPKYATLHAVYGKITPAEMHSQALALQAKKDAILAATPEHYKSIVSARIDDAVERTSKMVGAGPTAATPAPTLSSAVHGAPTGKNDKTGVPLHVGDIVKHNSGAEYEITDVGPGGFLHGKKTKEGTAESAIPVGGTATVFGSAITKVSPTASTSAPAPSTSGTHEHPIGQKGQIGSSILTVVGHNPDGTYQLHNSANDKIMSNIGATQVAALNKNFKTKNPGESDMDVALAAQHATTTPTTAHVPVHDKNNQLLTIGDHVTVSGDHAVIVSVDSTGLPKVKFDDGYQSTYDGSQMTKATAAPNVGGWAVGHKAPMPGGAEFEVVKVNPTSNKVTIKVGDAELDYTPAQLSSAGFHPPTTTTAGGGAVGLGRDSAGAQIHAGDQATVGSQKVTVVGTKSTSFGLKYTVKGESGNQYDVYQDEITKVPTAGTAGHVSAPSKNGVTLKAGDEFKDVFGTEFTVHSVNSDGSIVTSPKFNPNDKTTAHPPDFDVHITNAGGASTSVPAGSTKLQTGGVISAGTIIKHDVIGDFEVTKVHPTGEFDVKSVKTGESFTQMSPRTGIWTKIEDKPATTPAHVPPAPAGNLGTYSPTKQPAIGQKAFDTVAGQWGTVIAVDQHQTTLKYDDGLTGKMTHYDVAATDHNGAGYGDAAKVPVVSSHTTSTAGTTTTPPSAAPVYPSLGKSWTVPGKGTGTITKVEGKYYQIDGLPGKKKWFTYDELKSSSVAPAASGTVGGSAYKYHATQVGTPPASKSMYTKTVYNSPEWKPWVSSWKNSLTAAESAAVSSYKGDSSKWNAYLRESHGHKVGNMPASEKASMVHLDTAIAKSVIPFHTTVSREVNSGVWNKLKPGDIWRDKGYVGTSTDSPSFGTWKATIHVPAGSHGAYFDAVNKYGNEHEIVLPRGSTFRVISTGPNKVELELIPEPPFGTKIV